MKEHVIDKVLPGSIAEELEVEHGDVLVSVNGHEMEDVFDYQYYTNEEYLTVVIRKPNGEEWELDIEKEYEDDLGIEFANGLMDEYKSCRNKCIFCFIDQMPPGMRDTLYFKDDDSRLSFLQGNYVTLTNMSEKDLNRIIAYKLGPINISVQTTNPALRCKMLHNRFAGDALQKMDKLFKAGIPMNGQIVLCKGVNDGKELERSISDLMQYMPVMQSVSVVPVGLSRFREGLYPLEPFTMPEAVQVLELIHHFQEICMEKCGIHFIHASDEWYLLAGQELPKEERYDGYLQLENGVGMLRLLKTEFEEALQEAAAAAGRIFPQPSQEAAHTECITNNGIGHAEHIVNSAEHTDNSSLQAFLGLKAAKGRRRHDINIEETPSEHCITIATGVLAAPVIQELVSHLMEVFPEKEIQVIPIINHFFGEQITVSGLLTGHDIIEQLKGRQLGKKLLLSCNMLRSGEEVFLDDITLGQMESILQVKIDIVESGGGDLVQKLVSH